MTRRTFPDQNGRMALYLDVAGYERGVPLGTAVLYTDAGGTVLADIRKADGTATAVASTLTLDAFSQFPDFLGPNDDSTVLYVSVNGGPVTAIHSTDAAGGALDPDLTAIGALDSSSAGGIWSDGAGWVKKTAAQFKTALGLVKADVGLGNADNTSDANKPVSTAQAAADALALAKASNLSDLANPTTARTNLGLGSAATQPSSAFDAAGAASTAQTAAVASAKTAADSSYVTVVEHGSTAGTARPAGAVRVFWKGTVTPTNMAQWDRLIDVTNPAAPVEKICISVGPVVLASLGGGASSAAGISFSPAGTVAATDVQAAIVEVAGEAVQKSANLSDLASASTARTNLGLGNVDNTADTAKPVSTAQQTALDLKANTLTRTGVKTANYTAVMWDLVPCDTSGGSWTLTLPAASAKGRIALKLVTAGNTLNLALSGSDHFNTSTGPTTGTLSLANQGIIVESDGAGIWTVTADDIPLSVLDARFAPASGIAESAVTNLTTDLAAKAPLASPALTGSPTAPTQSAGDNSTKLATTAYVDKATAINAQSGTTYTLVLADGATPTTVHMSNASANTLTIPPNSSVAFPVGTVIGVYQAGAGLTAVAAGSGVTIRCRGLASTWHSAGQYAEWSMRKVATDEWVLVGDLVA